MRRRWVAAFATSGDGRFTTGTYYLKELPPWLKAFNDKKPADAYQAKDWPLLLPAKEYLGTDDAFDLLRQNKIEKIPLVDAGGRLRGLITVKDFTKSEKFPSATKDAAGRLVVGAAIGVGEDAKHRAQALLRSRYPQYRAMALEGLPVIALRIERVTGWGNLCAE